jgi:V8-like Glu-specific endopeptidase
MGRLGKICLFLAGNNRVITAKSCRQNGGRFAAKKTADNRRGISGKNGGRLEIGGESAAKLRPICCCANFDWSDKF